jgi:hypothetical protein
MVREFEVITYIGKKQKSIKVLFNTDTITAGQMFSKKGNLIKSKCYIYEGDKSYEVKCSYDKMKKFITPMIIIGFAGKSKNYGKSNNKGKRV